MNCEQATLYIENISLQTNQGEISEELSAHLLKCETCNAHYNQHQHYLDSIKNINTPELSASSAALILGNVRQHDTNQQHKPSRTSFMQGFVAASILAMAFFGSWATWQSHVNKQELVAEPKFITTEVVLVINTPEDVYDADLNLKLPSKVTLIGYENAQELTWPVDLKKGTNTLSLPIKVKSTGALLQPFSIMAKLYHYSEEREFEIKVDLSKV